MLRGGGEAVKQLLGILVVGWAAMSAAQPVVKENTGDLGYVYAFNLPPARGKVQPALALLYSSESNLDRGYGYGWDLSPFYIEEVTSIPLRRPPWSGPSCSSGASSGTSSAVIRASAT
jgi:hypothetical protein